MSEHSSASGHDAGANGEAGATRGARAAGPGARSAGKGRGQAPGAAPAGEADPAGTGPQEPAVRDWTDGHVARWLPVLPGLDPDIEGTVTRVKVLTDHLRRVRERSLADFDLHKHEYDTLHSLAGRGGRTVPSELAADLKMAPASITGRLDALERRGFVRRTPSADDRRRVDVELTAGRPRRLARRDGRRRPRGVPAARRPHRGRAPDAVRPAAPGDGGRRGVTAPARGGPAA